MDKTKFDDDAAEVAAQIKFAESVDALPSPYAAVCKLYDDAPAPIKSYLDYRFQEIIGVDVPKMAMLAHHGYSLDTEGESHQAIQEVYALSVESMRVHAPQVHKKLSATVLDSGSDIAEAIDKGISRATVGETIVNREAYLDILAAHAKIVRALEGLLELPEEVSDDSS